MEKRFDKGEFDIGAKVIFENDVKPQLEKYKEEKVAGIVLENNCIEEAVIFSNAHSDNEGAYLGFLAGAHYIVSCLQCKGQLK